MESWTEGRPGAGQRTKILMKPQLGITESKVLAEAVVF